MQHELIKELTLGQRYEILELIGSGGMADVYTAHDSLLDRIVAVKILKAELAGDAAFVEKFQREARAAAKLTHPNIVNIFDVGANETEFGTLHFIVMEYVSGETLKTKIANEPTGHLSVSESLFIAKEIARALSHAHQNNLVHCDIKPHNILITQDGRAKVADFGIARAVTSSTMTYNDNVIGSVHYFSPEQAKGAKVTPKSDVYSLGVVLFQMLTGILPFTGETPVSIALKHLQQDPPSLREIDDTIPPIVEAIVLRAMAKDPNERMTSHDLVDDIIQAENFLGFATFPTGATDPFMTQLLPRVAEEEEPPKKKKNSIGSKLLWIVGTLFLFALGVGIAFFAFSHLWSVPETSVPNVVGKNQTEAETILNKGNLMVEVVQRYDDDIPSGQVISQSPLANSKVKEGRVITLTVSRGGEEITVPSLKGLMQRYAEETLERAGLKIGKLIPKEGDDPAGVVLAQSPESGTKVLKGKEVDLIVSKGKQPKRVRVPNFAGGTLEMAKITLGNLKLYVGDVTIQKSRQAQDTIISQTPKANTEVEEGTRVDFVISDGSGAISQQPTVEEKPSKSLSRIKWKDKKNS